MIPYLLLVESPSSDNRFMFTALQIVSGSEPVKQFFVAANNFKEGNRNKFAGIVDSSILSLMSIDQR